jgi:hypothetical protein
VSQRFARGKKWQVRAYLACLTLVVACQRADPPAPSAATPRTSAEARRPAAGSRETAAHSHPIDQEPRLGAEWKAAREELAIRTRNFRWIHLIARERLLELGVGCASDVECTVFEERGGYRVEIAQRHRTEFLRGAVRGDSTIRDGIDDAAPTYCDLQASWVGSPL